MRLLSLFFIFIFILGLVPVSYGAFTEVPVDLLNKTVVNSQVVKNEVDEGIVFYSDYSEEIYKNDFVNPSLDRFTVITSYRFSNRSFVVFIDSEINQQVKISSPFSSSTYRFTMVKGINRFEVPVKPYYGLYMAGVHTALGDRFFTFRKDVLSLPDYPLMIALSEFNRSKWEYVLVSLFIFLLGFYFTKSFLSVVFFKLRSPLTIIQIFLFVLCFSLILGYGVRRYDFKETVKDKDGNVFDVTRQIKVYDFDVGDSWKDGLRFFFIIPFLIGLYLAHNVVSFKVIRVLLFSGSDMSYFELLESDSGLSRDMNFDSVVLEFSSEDEERMDFANVGECLLAVEYVKEPLDYPVSNNNSKYFAGVLCLEFIFSLLSFRFLSLSFHSIYYLIFTSLVFVVLNFDRILLSFGFVPSHKVVVKCSPVVSMDSVSKSVLKGTLEAVVDSYKKLVVEYVHEKVRSPFEIIDTLFGVNKRLLEESSSRAVDLKDKEEIATSSEDSSGVVSSSPDDSEGGSGE